jgi:integrative and conjugative element protein (TIGR02256 family)
LTVWIDPLAREQIELEARRRRFLETGGPLFGYESDEDLVVIGVGGPGPKARHGLGSFEPDRGAVDRAIAAVHRVSERRYRYLGSWHTHPLGRARPSGVDAATARSISEQPSVRLPRPLLIIQASRPLRRTFHDRDLRAFRWQDAHRRLASEQIRVLRTADRRYPVLDLDWDGLVT